MTPPSSLAIITPTYAPDFELCKMLNRSVLEFLPSAVKHYILVDRRDLALFRSLAESRTIVTSKEEFMPKGIVQLPGMSRWISRSTLLPISGWLVQQIAKIATAKLLREETLVMVDSDALFIRDIDETAFVRDGLTRLYRRREAIFPEMKSHITWHNNACRLLNVSPDSLPMDDYIGQVISWDRKLVRQMCDRIEAVSGSSWHAALARTRAVSEYLLYGLFVTKTTGAAQSVWVDERSRCKTHWEFSPLLAPELVEFATSLEEGDFALMISSHSSTTLETRRAAVELATNGRIR